MTDVDVLIVGAGPVGLALAVDLARRGVGVQLVDALAEPTPESRAVVVHSRTLDHFEALGVLDEIMARAIVSTGMELHSGSATIAAVSFEHIRAVHPFSVSLVQCDTEAVLAARLAELGVQVDRSLSLIGYVEDDDGLTATLAHAAGSSRVIRAKYLVGADGARSQTRHLMGQRLEGSFVGEDVLLGDVEAEHEYSREHFHAFFSPGETTGLLFPLRGNRVRVFVELPAGIDPHRAVTADWLQTSLDERGMRMRITGTHWLTRFELKHGIVPRYRSGRVFLVGDAAHIHSPAGALGMNTGIQDALNLGWKLAAAVRGDDAEPLLESYHDERRPIGEQVVGFTTQLTRLASIDNPVAQRVRNALMHVGVQVPVVTDRMASTIEQQHVHYRGSPIVSGRGGSLKPGDFLYLPGTNVASALAATTGHLAVVVPGRDARDPGLPHLDVPAEALAVLRDATGLRDGGVVIIRPDGYVGRIDAGGSQP